MWFKESVSQKKKLLAGLLKAPMEQLGQHGPALWHDADELSRVLQASLCKLPHCQLLYAIDINGRQLSPNISRHGVDNTWRGQDLSARPYLQGNLPFKGLVLSAAYLSQRSMQPCITAVQAVRDGERLLGFIAADFHIKDLPNTPASGLQRGWQSYRGDPAIRGTVFMQTRTHSSVDENIDYLIYVLSTLLQEHGVFHCKLHFSSARCTLWSAADPFSYRVHTVEELMNPELFLLYPKTGYDRRAAIEADRLPVIFAQLKALRDADDTIYLRSGSVNIVNALVGLTFSCDGSHYMNVEEFLNHDLSFWLGQTASQPDSNTTTPN
mgnify:CR=1 FL=1